MNIDEYRAMVAREKAEKESQVDQPDQTSEKPNGEAQSTEIETNADTQATPPEETGSQETNNDKPTKINIEGIGEVDLDEIKEWRQGYLRQSDYTRKTQELSKQKQELGIAQELYEFVQKNPEIAKQITSSESAPSNLKNLSPEQQRIRELEQKYYDLLVQKQVEDLSNKYEDFDAVAVLNTAFEKKISNLEDAYFIVKAQNLSKSKEKEVQDKMGSEVDIEAIKKELRDELLKELQNEASSTQTIIASNDKAPPSVDDQPKLSEQEDRVRRMMNLSVEEYIKWRDMK